MGNFLTEVSGAKRWVRDEQMDRERNSKTKARSSNKHVIARGLKNKRMGDGGN